MSHRTPSRRTGQHAATPHRATAMTVLGGMFAPAGPSAQPALDLWWSMVALAVPPFLLVAWLLAGALRRRHRPEDDIDHGRVGSRWLVLGGVVLPVVVVLATFAATVVAMRATRFEAPAGALEVEVTAFNYGWDVHHLVNGERLTGQVMIPVGEPIALRLTSRDVIHSFWVPELGGKVDALPDGTTTLVLEADQPGTYQGRCAEFCGIGHARMPVVVTALDAEDWAAWVEGA